MVDKALQIGIETCHGALQYSQLAAQRAMTVFAYSEAVRHLEQALRIQEVLDPDSNESDSICCCRWVRRKCLRAIRRKWQTYLQMKPCKSPNSLATESWRPPNYEADYRGFLEGFFSSVFSEPHSTKQIEDGVGWGLDTNPLTLAETRVGSWLDEPDMLDLTRRVKCPALLIHGDEDQRAPLANAIEVAKVMNAPLVTMVGSGHLPQVRDPVKVNHLIRDFVEPRQRSARTWVRGRNRRPRVLYVSSPIGLGHAAEISPSLTNCASYYRTLRSTGWRSSRSRGCSKGAVSGCIA